MKVKVTKKAIKENYGRIIGIGYCNAQHLLNYKREFAYSSGSNGWACDYYEVNGICISTGYNYIDSKGVKVDRAKMRAYESSAYDISRNYDLSYEDKKKQVNDLLEQFVNECLK